MHYLPKGHSLMFSANHGDTNKFEFAHNNGSDNKPFSLDFSMLEHETRVIASNPTSCC